LASAAGMTRLPVSSGDGNTFKVISVSTASVP
jgi:hypothetical protein